MKIKKKQIIAKKWFIELQNLICNNVEELEKELARKGRYVEEKISEEEIPKKKKVNPREKVIEIVEKDPEKAARLIKEWLRSRA